MAAIVHLIMTTNFLKISERNYSSTFTYFFVSLLNLIKSSYLIYLKLPYLTNLTSKFVGTVGNPQNNCQTQHLLDLGKCFRSQINITVHLAMIIP